MRIRRDGADGKDLNDLGYKDLAIDDPGQDANHGVTRPTSADARNGYRSIKIDKLVQFRIIHGVDEDLIRPPRQHQLHQPLSRRPDRPRDPRPSLVKS